MTVKTSRPHKQIRPKALRGQTYKGNQVVSTRRLMVGDSAEFDLMALRTELQEMVDVLMGREEPPIDTGVSTLMECAEAFHARGKEIEMQFHMAESDGEITKGSSHYRFRTQTLRSFIELCKGSMELGSRRVTALKIELDMEG